MCPDVSLCVKTNDQLLRSTPYPQAARIAYMCDVIEESLIGA